MAGDRALAGCRGVVTRPADGEDDLADRLRDLGAEVRSRPLVGIGPPADPGPLRAAFAEVASYDWLTFTSANAVRACGGLLPAGHSWPRVACVGPGTARAAAEAGIPVGLVPEVFSGEALAEAMVEQQVQGARVLWPRASGARETLALRLRSAGAEVHDVVCYRTLPDLEAAAALASELERDPAHVLVFTSPSAVRSLAHAAGKRPEAAVAVIGRVTAGAAEEAGWPVQIIPAEQSIPGLASAVAHWWADSGAA